MGGGGVIKKLDSITNMSSVNSCIIYYKYTLNDTNHNKNTNISFQHGTNLLKILII